MERTQLPIYELRNEDGRRGIQIGEDGVPRWECDGTGLFELLWAIFPDEANSEDPSHEAPVDAELIAIARQYMDLHGADRRREQLRAKAGTTCN